MKSIIILLSLFLTSHTNQATAASNPNKSICEVKIRVELSDAISQYPLIIDVDRKKYTIDKAQPEVCVSMEALDVYPRKYSTDTVRLYAVIDDNEIMLFDARAHNQADIIMLSATSTMANAACPLECSYYEYKELMKNHTIINAATHYNNEIINDKNTVTNYPQRRKIFGEITPLYKGLYDSLLPSIGSLGKMPKHEQGYGVNSYMRSSGYWSKYQDLSNKFIQEIKPRTNKIYEGGDRKALNKLFKPFAKELRTQYSQRVTWEEKDKGFLDIAKRMIANENQAVRNYGTMLVDISKELNQSREEYLNTNRVDFKNLADKDMSKQEVIAHWLRYAYHHVEETEKFAALFSKKYRLEIFNTISKDRKLDKSQSKLVSLFYRIAMLKSDEYAFKRLMHEYQYAAKKNGDKIIVNDALEQLVLIYEMGMWRMDSANILKF